MIQGLGGRDAVELRTRRSTEWSAGCGEDYTIDFAAKPGAQALVDSVVLAVNRQQFGAGPFSLGHHEVTGGNQGFFIGQCYSKTQPDGCMGSF